MNPTVKITSYKKLFIDQVLAYGSGSGTVINPDGLVVTNHHVIFDENEFKPLDAFEVCITFDVQKEPVCNYTARLVDSDKDMDIALLKINSTDVFGAPVPTLKHLNYHNDGTPAEQSQIHVVGYPGSGGETITMTQGQISGFEEFNNFQYFKTDTDFDHGSSGGTALDENGNFIGIPTYIRSYAENVGYFLNLKEARGWLNNVEDKKPEENLSAEQLLKKELARFSKANEDLKYTQEHYPFMQLALPEGWEFLEINDDSFFATQKNQSNPVGISVFIAPYQFKVDDGYLDKLNEELEGIKETFPDYKKEKTTFAGQLAWKVTYTSMSSKNITYYLPYGYAMIGIGYSIDLNEEEIQIAAMEPVINALTFTKNPLDDPRLSQVIQFDNPPFEITMAGDWSALKNKDKQSRTLLVEAVEKDNFEGSFAIYYDQVSKDERHLTAEVRLEEVIKNLGSRKLVYKNDEVVLGGLEGYLYTYEYEGRDYQKIRKHMIAKVRDGD
ncbi:trypsin-like peptidase domain-containing protein, partial [Candidatus Pacearchaeota archaeon]|nr:trypsin-like peptidase domain-containing protein [Candidatus Pacearchaeota archaeon]